MSWYDALPPNLAPIGLRRKTAAQFMGVSETTFDKMIVDGLVPSGKRIYGRRLWDRRDLEASLAAIGGAVGVQAATTNPRKRLSSWDDLLA